MKNALHNLNEILKHGIMSPLLKEAISETIKAINEKNLKLAYQISACKSYVVGKINPNDKRNAFQEDEEKNKELFERCIYSILDGVHHDIAFEIDSIPSGMVVFNTVNGSKVKEFKSIGEHPIVKRIKYEDKVTMLSMRKQIQLRKRGN